MTRRLVPITLDNLGDVRGRCRGCVRWELDAVACARAEQAGDPALEKEAWVSSVLLDWGSCGRLLYVDGVPAGHVLYAPPVYVPRAMAFPTSPVSPDAVLLTTAYVAPELRGGGLGRMLVQAVVKDLAQRGVKALEAFGDARPDLSAKEAKPVCLVPAEHFLAVGFKTVRPHPRFPRLRLEVRTALSWREDVELAIERLLGSMTPEPSLRPV